MKEKEKSKDELLLDGIKIKEPEEIITESVEEKLTRTIEKITSIIKKKIKNDQLEVEI